MNQPTDRPESIDDQVLSKARAAAEQRDQWLRRLAEFTDQTAHRLNKTIARVVQLEETFLTLGREAGDSVVDAYIRCGAEYDGAFGRQTCDLPDDHTLHSWERATEDTQGEDDLCDVTMMVDHGRRRVTCKLPYGHDGIHTQNP